MPSWSCHLIYNIEKFTEGGFLISEALLLVVVLLASLLTEIALPLNPLEFST